MSIRDYNMKYLITNGNTGEIIKVPKIDANYDTDTFKNYKVSKIILIETILEELKDCESVTISKSYMRDD